MATWRLNDWWTKTLLAVEGTANDGMRGIDRLGNGRTWYLLVEAVCFLKWQP